MPFDNDRRQRPEGGGQGGERAINLPPTILWIIVVNLAIQGLRELLSDAADQGLILQFALIPANYSSDAGDLLSKIVSPVTYQFLHGGWVHVGVNMLSLAAFGAPVERILGPRRFLAFYICAGIVAGFIHVAFFADSSDPVVGASGAISGVFGGVLMLLRSAGRMSSLLPVAGIWIALNVFFGYFGATPGAGGEPVAWLAHIGGFVFGLAAIHFFVPRSPA